MLTRNDAACLRRFESPPCTISLEKIENGLSGDSVPTLIMVEDSILVRERLREMLAEFPNLKLVGEYDHAAAAIVALRKRAADIVLLDIKLKGGTGRDVLRHVKQTHPSTKVIVFTNHSDHEYRELFTQLGADYFFSKTHETTRLRETLERLCADQPGST
jgi:two-component system OmpR family response regulator